MKKSHLGLLFVSISPVLSLVHGCAGELDNPSSFVDASFFNGTGGGGGAGGTGGSGSGTGGSGGSGMMGCPEAVTYLQMTCGVSTCHGPPAQVGLDLSKIGTGQQYISAEPMGLCAGHALIDPNDAQKSLLYLILQNPPTRPCGLLMPFGSASPIAQTQQACVLSWIESVLASGGGAGGSGGGADAGADASTGAGGSIGTGGSTGAGGSAGGAGR